MRKLAFICLTILIGFGALLLLDILWPTFMPLPRYLNKATTKGYSSNYRNYFEEVERDGKKYYTIPEENSPPPLPDSDFQGISILSIGDSFTYGQGVKRNDTYSAWLNRLSKDQVRALNKGVIGINIENISDVLKNYPKKNYQDFDYVLYGFCPNDITNRVPNNELAFDHQGWEQGEYQGDWPFHWDFINLRTNVIDNSRANPSKKLSQYSNIAHYILRKMELEKLSQQTMEFYKKVYTYELNQEGWDDFFEHVNRMKFWAEERKAKFIFLAFPLFYWPNDQFFMQKEFDSFISRLKDNHIEVIDLREIYFSYKDSELWVHPTDQHPNDLAHKLAAQKVLEYLGINY